MSTRRRLVLVMLVLLPGGARFDRMETDTSAELDEEGDSAPYAVAVELAGGGRCAGSLVAARSVLTSAGCARGRPARALTAGGARKVRRVVSARGAAEGAPDEPAAGWGGALLDLAVLVLDKAIASPARPISMAIDAAQCEEPHTACVVAGSLAVPGEHRVSLRVADATVAEGGTCSSRARFWASVKDRALCLTGPKLCTNDRGAGVVCSERLCGVVSRSLGGAADATAEGCGYTHAVQSLPRWRRFLHCAHSQQGCRSEQCAEVCIETEFMQGARVEEQDRTSHAHNSPDDYDTVPYVTTSKQNAPPFASSPTELRKKAEDKIDIVTPTTTTAIARSRPRPSRPRTRPSLSSSTLCRRSPPTRSPAGRRQRPRSEYEPNRPDFRAGEYGDTVVDYEENEEPPGMPPPPALLSRNPAPYPTHTANPCNTSAHPHTRLTAPPERLVSVLLPPLAPLTSGDPQTTCNTWLAVAALFAIASRHCNS